MIVLDKTLYSDDILSDLWRYLANNNILFGMCFAHSKHPFSRGERRFAFIVYICGCVTVAALVARYTHKCEQIALNDQQNMQQTQIQKQNINIRKLYQEIVQAPPQNAVSTVTKCNEHITIFGCIVAIVGIYCLRKFFKILGRCSKIDDIASNYNYFIGLFCKLIAMQANCVIMIVGIILCAKGTILLIKPEIDVKLIFVYVGAVFIVSLSIQLIIDIFDYFTKRKLEVRFKQLKETPEDPYAEIRVKNKTNFYIF